METGVLNTENLSQVLRNLSQKRKQGSLELTAGESHFAIWFIQGKIVEAVERGRSPYGEVFDLLSGAGLVKGPVDVKSIGGYSALQSAIAATGARIDASVFKRAIRHRVLDKLYGVDLKSGSHYSFKVQMIDSEEGFSPSISVGQLLLDLVAFKSDAERFFSLFGPDSVLATAVASPTSLSDEERIIFDIAKDGATIEDIARSALLSRYHLQDAILSMHDRGILESVADVAHDEHPERTEGSPEDILSALDTSIDDTFAAEFGSASAIDGEFEDDVSGYGEVEGIRIRAKLRMWSAASLNLSRVPTLVVAILLAAVVLIPVFTWGPVFAIFAE